MYGVQGWHDPVMVGSAATVADHNVPGAYPATLIHMRTKLKLPLAKEARNHVLVLRHGLTFGTPYPANLPKGQSRGARSSAGLVTVTVQGERYRSLTRIAFDSIVVDKLLADQPAKLRGVAGVMTKQSELFILSRDHIVTPDIFNLNVSDSSVPAIPNNVSP